jgi:hypothetical protein
MRPIAEIDCGLRQTPVADDAPDREKGKVNSRGEPKLSGQVKALRPTPTSLASAKNGNNEAGNSAGLVAIRNHAMAMWPTPTSALADKGVRTEAGAIKEAMRNHGPDLAAMSVYAMWPTPTSRDWKDGTPCPNVPVNGLLGRTVWPGSSEPTEKPGALNPAFVCWLMGYPPAWDACAPTATRSSRKSGPKFSAPISTEVNPFD